MDPDEVLKALRANAAANERNEQMLAEFASVFETLMTILQHNGELTEAQVRLITKLRKRASVVNEPKIELSNLTDKYEVESTEIDCASRMHLCHGRCCSFTVRLSAQDLKERKLEWEIDKPYLLARDARGYCVYQTDEGGCGNYEHRPAVCREYDCRTDQRVWVDFDKMIPAPMPNGLVTIRRTPKSAG